MRESGVQVSEDAPYTLLAQRKRVPDSDSGGRGFKSLRACHKHEWRNWKTRCAKEAVPERACEFDSRLVYQKYITGWLTNKAEKEMKTIKII